MRCLIIQKNRTVANIIEKGLEAYGYIVDKEIISEQLFEKIRRRLYKLIFVDLDVEKEKGAIKLRNLVEELKEGAQQPYLFGIGAKNEWKRRIKFLKAGGDDVISYPFMVQELLARIQSLLRRPRISNKDVVHIETLSIDTSNHKVFNDNEPVNLRRKEYRILEYMIRNPNRPISRTELLDHVWDYKRITGSNTVDVHINQIRNKIDCPKLIETVYGFGYKLNDSSSTRDSNHTYQKEKSSASIAKKNLKRKKSKSDLKPEECKLPELR
ncbi:response regulator [Candidatus Dojkabacteria bacterium]|nr:response regulator [Candidatus Dojkabacteria bacterium]